MNNAAWQDLVEELVAAKACLGCAWRLLDETDGAAAGVEEAVETALRAIDAVYAIERDQPTRDDVATPMVVELFWCMHRALPGFAIGAR